MICAIVVAHNEDLILEHTLEQLDLPYIAILDNPTERVKELTQNAIHTIQTDNQNGAHVYQWDKILLLIKGAALYAREKNFKWILRVDADEDWCGAVNETLKINRINPDVNIINFKLKQYKPLKERVSIFTPEDQSETQEGDDIHLEPDGNFYQRAWKLDTDKFNIGAGGHVILRKNETVYNSNYRFKHYPAIDKFTLRKKAFRKCSEKEKRKGWHIQYKNVVKPEKNIHVFYHLAMMGCWKQVLNEQIEQLQESGLLNICKSFTVVCVGEKKDIPTLNNIDVKYSGELKQYEFPTLHLMHSKAKECPGDYFLYIHSKGVSKPQFRRWLDSEWRKYMMFGCVENWETCVSKLDEGFDVAGVEWYPDLMPCKFGGKDGKCHGFFAGNFFWSTGKHLNTLPDVIDMDLEYRWNAEAWIGLGQKPEVFELINLHCIERRGMFNRRFSRKTYEHFNKIIFVDVNGNVHSKNSVNKKIISKLSDNNCIVFVRGVKQKFLMRANFLQVLSEPKKYDEKITI